MLANVISGQDAFTPRPTEETHSFADALEIGGVKSMQDQDPAKRAQEEKLRKLGMVMDMAGINPQGPMGAMGGVMSALAQSGHDWSSIGQGIKSVLGGK